MNSPLPPDAADAGAAPDTAGAAPPPAAGGVVALPPNGATVAAAALHDRLIAAARDGATVIDGSAVQTVGQAVLQLLVAARRDAAARRTPCTIVNPSKALRAAVAACCLADELCVDAGEAVVP